MRRVRAIDYSKNPYKDDIEAYLPIGGSKYLVKGVDHYCSSDKKVMVSLSNGEELLVDRSREVLIFSDDEKYFRVSA